MEFPEKDLSLKVDVGVLGELLGNVLKEQGGAALFDPVEQARVLARQRRQDDPKAEAELTQLLSGLSPTLAEEVVRAFSAYFGLVNLAERVHRIRRRREYLKADAKPQPGSLHAVFVALREAGVPWTKVEAVLSELSIEPVFTAHPTEATRRTLLLGEQRIARALVERLSPDALVPGERHAIAGRIQEDVTIAWQTEEHPSERPTVADEVEHVVFYLNDIIYRIVPAFVLSLESAVRATYPEAAEWKVTRPVVRFASWVGGDMDGNPNVGADTMLATLERHRALIIERYRDEVLDLFRRLSQSDTRVTVSSAVVARVAEYQNMFPQVSPRLPSRYASMPYRALLAHVDARLLATLRDTETAYPAPDVFLNDLQLIVDSLRAHKGAHAGLSRLQRLVLRVQTFGFHLAALDLRQESTVHRRVLAELLGDPEFVNRPATERVAALEKALVAVPAFTHTPSPEAQRTMAVFLALVKARSRFGAQALGSYIISMATGPDDVLAVLVLARAAGLVDDAGHVPLDVAPLFETVPDLHVAPQTLASILAHDGYRNHVKARGGRQVVMLGYSDSNKESGIVASRWALDRAQVALVETTDAAGVGLTLFHGRGGTASRGGSKPREGILAQPPGTVRGHLRVTEQGEIIHAKYGLRDIAMRTLEIMAGATLQASMDLGSPTISQEARAAFEAMAQDSRQKYRALVYENPEFTTYFAEATPLDVIQRLAIGSRPSSRSGKAGVLDLRAIPWTFAWTQNRHLITGWYGMGTGLEKLVAQAGMTEVRKLYDGSAFFQTLIADAEMVLAKADMPIAKHYAALAGDLGTRVFAGILSEFETLTRLIREIRQETELLDAEPVLKRAIRLRNPYVDPMSLVQVDFLARWRASGREDDALLRVLLTTVRGIARGLQNTG